jgi:alpha-1,3-rhamnosyl/mannosyltransferase
MSGREPRPLRLALDATPLLEAEPTGVARAFRGWLRGLMDREAPPEITLFVPGDKEVHDPPDGMEVVRLPGGAGFRWRGLPRELARRRPHLFHSPFMAVPPPCGVPRVATVHEVPGLGSVGPEGPTRALRQAAWWRLARRGADGLVAISCFTARAARRSGWRDRPLAVVPHGVDADDRAGALESRADGPVVALGTLRRKKGVRLALAARDDLVTRVPREAGRSWVWFGSGRAPTRRPGGIRFPGYRPDAEVRDALRAAACLIVPSLTEGFGLPVLEAMAAGCPVIVADAGALPEAAGRGGWVVKGRDPAVWSATIERVVAGGGEVEARVRRGLARARRQTWTRAADRLLRLYGSVLASSSSGGASST